MTVYTYCLHMLVFLYLHGTKLSYKLMVMLDKTARLAQILIGSCVIKVL